MGQGCSSLTEGLCEKSSSQTPALENPMEARQEEVVIVTARVNRIWSVDVEEPRILVQRLD